MSENNRQLAQDQLAFGALLGLCILAVFQFLSFPALDIPLTIALYSFAVAIPFLTLYLANLIMSVNYKHVSAKWYHGVAIGVGGIAPIVGMGAMMWHFSKLLGFVFTGLIAIMAAFFIAYDDDKARGQ